MKKITLIQQTPTPDNFAPYGVYVEKAQPTFSSASFDWHENLASFSIGTAELGFVQVKCADPYQQQLERHMHTCEVMIPVNGELYVVLAKGEAVEEDDFAAFSLPPGCAAVLNAGIWHLAPKSKIIGTGAFILYTEGTGEKDKEIIELAERGLEVNIQW